MWCGDLNVARTSTDLHRGIFAVDKINQIKRDMERGLEDPEIKEKAKKT